MKRQKTAVASDEPRSKWETPPWYRRHVGSAHHKSHSIQSWLDAIDEGLIRIPRFQRAWTWTDEQVVRLIDSILGGYHVGNMLLWARAGLQAARLRFGEFELDAPAQQSGWSVVDGQQRLAALATARCAERFKLDLRDGKVTVHPDDAPWLVPMGLLMAEHGMFAMFDGWAREHAERHRIPTLEVESRMIHAAQMICGSYALSAIELPERWSIERVVESFRRLNSEGTVMDPKHLRTMLMDE